MKAASQTLHRFDEAGFLLEMPRHKFLHQLVRVAALVNGGLFDLRFEFRGEVYFHDLHDTGKLGMTQRVGAGQEAGTGSGGAARATSGSQPTLPLE